MREVVLDTSIVIRILKGDEHIRDLLKSYVTGYLPITVVGELLLGPYNSN